jgi:hypothetical protein
MTYILQRFQESSPAMQLYTIFIFWLIAFSISVGLVQLLWNTTLPKIGPFGRITFWQAVRLVILGMLLTGTASFIQITLNK